MSRFTIKDVLAFALFVVILLSGTAAGYFRWFRSRGIGGTVREAVETSMQKPRKAGRCRKYHAG